MRRMRVGLIILAGVTFPCMLATAIGSTTLFNDTGSDVYGLRVVFDQPVTITNMGTGFGTWTV